jgi:hypothetical protein
LRVAPQLARVFRILRVARLAKLIKRFPTLQKILQTLVYSIPPMANLLSITMLVYFMFAVLATFLFQKINAGEVIQPYVGFYNFGYSLLTLYRCATGEDWYRIMFDTAYPQGCSDGSPGNDCGPGASVCWVFWIAFIVVGQYIFLNLFVMPVTTTYEEYYVNSDSPLTRFNENVDNFKTVWKDAARRNQGLFIGQKQLVPFFMKLEVPLGFKPPTSHEVMLSSKAAGAKLMKLNMQADTMGNISFHEVMFGAF